MDKQELASEVRRRRAAAGLTLREVSERSGVDYSLIARIEKAERNVTIDTARRVLDALAPAPDPYAATVARFAALLPRLDDAERVALLSMIALLEQHHPG